MERLDGCRWRSSWQRPAPEDCRYETSNSGWLKGSACCAVAGEVGSSVTKPCGTRWPGATAPGTGRTVVFDRLSVFAGGFTLQAAAGVCAGQGVDELDVEDAVLGLVDRSMVVVETGADSTRYRLLETLRQFGEAQLLERAYRRVAWPPCPLVCGVRSAGRSRLEGPRRSGLEQTAPGRARQLPCASSTAARYLPARRILASLEAWPLFWETFEYIDWAVAVIDPAAPDTLDWIGTALWAAYGVDFAGRRGDIDTLLAQVDPGQIPPGMLSYMWSYHQLINALRRGERGASSRCSLTAPRPGHHSGQRLRPALGDLLCELAGHRLGWVDSTLPPKIWSTLADDPARHTVPTVEPMFFSTRGSTSLRSVTPRRLTASRPAAKPRSSAATRSSNMPPPAIRSQSTSNEATSPPRGSGSPQHLSADPNRQPPHAMMALPGLVALLDEIRPAHDQAREIWAELAGTGTSRWCPLIGPTSKSDSDHPADPALDGDQLVTRTAEILRQLEQATPTLGHGS